MKEGKKFGHNIEIFEHADFSFFWSPEVGAFMKLCFILKNIVLISSFNSVKNANFFLFLSLYLKILFFIFTFLELKNKNKVNTPNWFDLQEISQQFQFIWFWDLFSLQYPLNEKSEISSLVSLGNSFEIKQIDQYLYLKCLFFFFGVPTYS